MEKIQKNWIKFKTQLKIKENTTHSKHKRWLKADMSQPDSHVLAYHELG